MIRVCNNSKIKVKCKSTIYNDNDPMKNIVTSDFKLKNQNAQRVKIYTFLLEII